MKGILLSLMLLALVQPSVALAGDAKSPVLSRASIETTAAQDTESLEAGLALTAALLEELEAIDERLKTELAPLTAALKAASPQDRQALRKQASDLKREAHLEGIRVRLHYARRQGLEEEAQKLEAAIERLTSPRPAIRTPEGQARLKSAREARQLRQEGGSR